MDFEQTRETANWLFNEAGFKELADKSFKKSRSDMVALLDNEHNSSIHITYPGYRAREKPGQIDFRVDLRRGEVTRTFSHLNIIVDIINKCQRGIDIDVFRDFLSFIFVQSDDENITSFKRSLNWKRECASEQLLNEVSAIYERSKRNPFDATPNQWDLEIDELAYMIKWIAIQEDINYPIEKNLLGRRMCYIVYCDAISYFEGKHVTTLNYVVGSALIHRKRIHKITEYEYRRYEEIE